VSQLAAQSSDILETVEGHLMDLPSEKDRQDIWEVCDLTQEIPGFMVPWIDPRPNVLNLDGEWDISGTEVIWVHEPGASRIERTTDLDGTAQQVGDLSGPRSRWNP
jgi:hypothetical protein